MFIAWTTVADRLTAESLAADVIAQSLAACAQIEGPITSFYRWEGRLERTEEFRLCLKCTKSRLAALEAHVLEHHPYAIPEWIVTRAEHVGEKYLSWAEANSTNPTL